VPSYPDLAVALALAADETLEQPLVAELFDQYVNAGEYRSLYQLAKDTGAPRAATAEIKRLHTLAQSTLLRSAIEDGIASEAQLRELLSAAIDTQPAQWIAPAFASDSRNVDWFFEQAPRVLERIRARRTAQFARWLEAFDKTNPDLAALRAIAPLPAIPIAALSSEDIDALLAASPEQSGDEVSPRPDPTREGLVYGYAIVEQIARTGSSVVYRARHILTKSVVALKVVPRAGVDPRALEMFRREVWLTLRARSASVVRVFDFGGNRDYYFLALELLLGETLSAKLNRVTKLSASETLHVVRDVVRSLAEIHRAGLVHGDVKPLNIFLCETGAVKLFDFGCATECGSGSLMRGMGSPPYIAPEQGCGNGEGKPLPIDPRSDLYALGVTLFHMLTGTLPITNKRLENFWRWQIEEDVPHVHALEPTIPHALADIVFRLTRKQPEARYQDAAELVRDLDACQ